jgi:nitrile hydratase
VTAAPTSHMTDFEGHVAALEADIEYWRTKRLEPRIVHFVRRNVLPLHALLAAAAGSAEGDDSSVDRGRAPGQEEEAHAHGPGGHEHGEHEHEHEPLETRIRALEDRLDDYVRGIALAATEPGLVDFVIDDSRTESGAYDEFLRFTKRKRGGTLAERLDRLDRELTVNAQVLDTFVRALVATGLIDPAEREKRRARLASRQGEWNGARIVARAWVDPDFKARLLSNGRDAVQELDIPPGRLAVLAVAENTPSVHHVIVCTLCSCYPNELLGHPPWWYRDESYKRQIVHEPRSTLAEMFGLEIPDSKVIDVHDSTSDLRWFVLPERPAGTEDWSEAELAGLVTMEALVGVATPVLGNEHRPS